MRNLNKALLFLSLTGCNLYRQCLPERWSSTDGSVLEFTCKGEIGLGPLRGPSTKTTDNFLIWHLPSPEGDVECYFAVSGGGVHGNFVCPELDISSAFYRLER